MSRWRMSRRRAGARDRGAMAVEFAIVVPVLTLLVIAMLEFSMVMRDWLGVSSAVRLGVRVAASAGDAGEAICPGPPVICAPSTTPALAQSAADAIQRSGTSMPKELIDFIWVYQANNSGWPTNAVATAATSNAGAGANNQTTALANGCNTSCVKFRWNDTLGKFVYDSGVWNSAKINMCVNSTLQQQVGVYMQATHPFLTSFIRRNMTLSDKAIMTFEPRQAGRCAVDEHV